MFHSCYLNDKSDDFSPCSAIYDNCAVCQKNSEFKCEIQGHFIKFSRRAPKFSNLAKVKIRRFFSVGKSLFLQSAVTLRLTNGRPPLTLPKEELGLPVAAPRGCNGALIALQRGRRCNPTGTPLQGRAAAIARKRALLGSETAIKNPRSFAKSESRGALNGVCEAAGLSPLGESEGAVRGL